MIKMDISIDANTSHRQTLTSSKTISNNESQQLQWLNEILSQSKSHGLSYFNIEPFLQTNFDPQEYANRIIESTSSSQNDDGEEKTSDSIRRDLQAKNNSNNKDSSSANANWLPQSGRMEGDLSVALGRLNMAIDDVDRLVREEVTKNANTLLKHTTTLLDLRPSMDKLTNSLESLDNHQSRLVDRISIPQKQLQDQIVRLSKMRSAQSTVKQSQKFVRLLRRLQMQMQDLGGGNNINDRKMSEDQPRLERLGEETGEENSVSQSTNAAIEDVVDTELDENAGRGLSRAAMTVAEIMSLLNDQTIQPPKEEEEGDSKESLLDLAFVQECLPIIEEARERVTEMMEDMIVRGLRDLEPTLLSTSLQTASNLGQLTDLVRDLLADLTDVVRERVRAAFDMQSLSRELGSKEPQHHPQSTSYRARRGGDYSTALHTRWNNAIWNRFEHLIIVEMGAVCSKVYTLERVLSLKNDSNSGLTYLDQAMNVLGDRPSAMFWSTLANAIAEESNRSTSSFLIQTLEQSYPKLLKIFQEFYSKVSVYTGTTYSHAYQSSETLITLRSLARFEDTFLSRCSSRFDSLLSSSFTAKQPPGSKEGLALTKIALNELEAAHVDPLLLHGVGKIVLDWLGRAARRIEDLIIQDTSSQSLQSLHPSHIRNASLTGAAYQLHLGLQRITDQSPKEYKERMQELQSNVHRIMENKLTQPLLQSICKEISDVMTRMQYVDFGLDRDAVSGSGSAYMVDLSDRMWFIREQLLVRYDIPTDDWLLKIAKYSLQSFITNASLIRPLKEGGKLKLTSDMTELEFSISQLLASSSSGSSTNSQQPSKPLSMTDCGKEFRALRSFRHLLFANVTQWISSSSVEGGMEEEIRSGLSALVVSHHLISRSKSIELPNELHKWNRIEYLRWLNSHSIQEGIQLIKGCLESWRVKKKEDEQNENQQKDEDDILAECLEKVIKFVEQSEGE